MNEYLNDIKRIPLLTEEETSKLIIAMHNGDNEARKILIEHNLRLVSSIAYKYIKIINLPIEDLVSIGSFGLIRAIDNYDSTREAKLSSVAYIYIENEFKRHINFLKSQKRDSDNDVSLQENVFENKDGDEITREDIVKSDGLSIEDTILQNICNEKLREILNKLTKEERKIIFLRYGLIDGINHSLEEIAQEEGVTKQNISVKEIRALKKLKHPRITKQIKDFYEE